MCVGLPQQCQLAFEKQDCSTVCMAAGRLFGAPTLPSQRGRMSNHGSRCPLCKEQRSTCTQTLGRTISRPFAFPIPSHDRFRLCRLPRLPPLRLGCSASRASVCLSRRTIAVAILWVSHSYPGFAPPRPSLSWSSALRLPRFDVDGRSYQLVMRAANCSQISVILPPTIRNPYLGASLFTYCLQGTRTESMDSYKQDNGLDNFVVALDIMAVSRQTLDLQSLILT